MNFHLTLPLPHKHTLVVVMCTGFYNVTPDRRELVLFLVSLDGPILSVVCDLSAYWIERKDTPPPGPVPLKTTGSPPFFTVPYRGDASDKHVLYGEPSIESLTRVAAQLKKEALKFQHVDERKAGCEGDEGDVSNTVQDEEEKEEEEESDALH
jgi:hypothetical protein